jgi:Family of unknown function (DUF6252)
MLGSILCQVFFLSCSQSIDPLPKETQSGQNTLACRIDGAAWKPYIEFDFSLKGNIVPIVRYSFKSKTLYVNGLNQKDGRIIAISLINFTGVGTYKLVSNNADMARPVVNSGAFSPSTYIYDNTFWTDATHKGEVIITRLSDGIVSGRFSYDAFNPKTNKTVGITDGRFDYYYRLGVDD